MSKARFLVNALALIVLTLGVSSLANAQATRTWVSALGDDANPCSRTAPCKTFAGAISKTALGGEIDALDPGGYGAVTITKSITIDGGIFGSILASSTTGVIVNITSTDIVDPKKVVILRRLSINGAGNPSPTGIRAINFLAGKQLSVENSQIFGFVNEGIRVSVAANALLSVKDTNITNCATGISGGTTVAGQFLTAVMDRVRLEKMADGLVVGDRMFATVRDSVAVGNTTSGLKIQAPSNQAGLNVEATIVNNNGVGIAAGGGGTVVDLSNTSIMNNTTGITTGGGTVNSHGNNAIANNAAPGTAPSIVGPQ